MALRTLKVFISSPGDVTEERLIARRVIGRLDAQFGDHVQIEAVLWERVPLAATASFQEQLIRPSDTDVAVVILWSRLGTPLPASIHRVDGSTYASGTEFEFEDAVAGFRRGGKPRILAYRKTAPIAPPDDLEGLEESVRQKQAMEGFVSRWFRHDADGTLKGAFHNFAAPADFEELLEAHLTQLAEQYLPAGTTARGSAPTWRGRSPFRGLEVFEPQHAPVFFGRTAATASVLAKLRTQGHAGKAFVLIVSMSGGGKSSLVRAGVLPLMLQAGVVGDATQWRSAVMRPSDGRGRLVDALERALMQATTIGDAANGEATAAVEPMSADALVRRVVDRLDALATTAVDDAIPRCDLVLVVDQLEEAFSDERVSTSERDAFFAALDALARSGRVWIIATMRSDAYPLIAAAPTLVALKEGEGQYDLLPPTLREIGQIIRFPAAAAGLRFETRSGTAEKLDDVIRDAAASNPGALPLLQFLLEALYQRRNAEDILTFRAYEDLGGVEGALAQRAEAVLAGVSDGAQKALPSVLRELVTFGTDDDSKALRRVAPRSAFETREQNELVDALVEARLLVSSLGADGTSTIALAHEALLEYWPRLKAWRDEDRELLLVHARLAATTREWERNARNDDLLLARGKPLAEARGLVGAGVRLSAGERALLGASERRARRFAILRNSAIGGLAVLAVVAGIAAYKANIESKRAQVQAITAQRTTDFMVGLFANADPDQNRGERVTVREVLDGGVVQIRNELTTERSVRSNLLRAMGQSYTGLGLYSKAKDVLADALADSEKSENSADRIATGLALAENYYQEGDYQKSESIYRTLLDDSKGNRSMSIDQRVLALTGLGECLAELNQSDAADKSYMAALDLHTTAQRPDSETIARLFDDRGRLAYLRANYDLGIQLTEKALHIRRSLFGSDDNRVARTLSNIGSMYYQAGRVEEAAKSFSAALPIYEKVFGPEHRLYAGLLNNLARIELLTGHVDQAEMHFKQVLSIYRKSLPDGHDSFILPLNSLAMIYLSRHDPSAARPLLEESKAIAIKRKHWMLDQILTNEAELQLENNELDAAQKSLAAARQAVQQQYGSELAGKENWRNSVIDLTEAEYYLKVHDRTAASVRLESALPVLQQRFGSDAFFVKLAKARQAETRR